jgi:hypothetical protein
MHALIQLYNQTAVELEDEEAYNEWALGVLAQFREIDGAGCVLRTCADRIHA